MILMKKLAFAPIFLVFFIVLLYQFVPIAASSDFIFSLSLDTLVQFIVVSLFFTLSAFLFIVFATLAQNWKITLPISIAAAGLTLPFIGPSQAIILVASVLISLVITLVILNAALASYLTFQPGKVIGPSVKLLSTLLVLSFCIVYFLSMNQVIAKKGFQVPDSLIDTALKMSPVNLPQDETSTQTQLPNITPEQIALLKQNPDLLKQSGLDPKILDTLSQPQTTSNPQNLTQQLVKQAVKDQVQNIIKPYISYIPAFLAVLLFFTLQFFTSIINIFLSPLLSLTFLILEKTGYTHYQTEQREVKKLVV